MSPTQLNVEQAFLILWFNRGYFKGKLLFACRINFLSIFHGLPTVHKRAEGFKCQFFTQSLLSASHSLPDYSRDHPAPPPGAQREPNLIPPTGRKICGFILFSAQFYLTVNAKHEQHGEEEYCPQRGDGQLCHCLWVSQKCQSRACGEKQETKHHWAGLGWGFSALFASGCSPWAEISAV